MRRWWAGLALLLGGAACLTASYIFQDDSWPSGTLLEFGATFMLFAPLLMVQRRIEKRFDVVETTQEAIQNRQTEAAAELSALAEDVAQTKNEMRLTLEQLSDVVTKRMQEAKSRDKETFASVAAQPSLETIDRALQRAHQLKLITRSGCRVALFNEEMLSSNFYVRFVCDRVIERMEVEVQLYLEGRDGTALERYRWHGDTPAADVLVWLAEQVQGLGKYLAGVTFEPTVIFTGLRELLELAHRKAIGEDFHGFPGPIFQLCLPQWAVTESGIARIDGYYTVPGSRLEEMDWYEHIGSKGWADESSLYEVLESARALFIGGLLDNRPPF
ncbi:hypothetical protein ACIG5D_36420 [Microbispora rosea]|uniref:hypothetical protein n=1 Tax=Microbispora rosea TaxID=58117 RepID=UPI0037CAA0F9